MNDARMNQKIKSVIAEFPAIEQILKEYGVGCGACTVGTCLVKDIVSIHDLSKAREEELLKRFDLVFKGQVAEAMAMAGETTPVRILYSTPVQRLVNEHRLIKRFIALIPEITASLDLSTEKSRDTLAMGIDMIRNYADRFHHAKEEDILFKYTDETAGIIQVMYEDHHVARAHVRAMVKGLGDRDTAVVVAHLTAYGALLTEHIKKEDEILYPFIDKGLSGAQIRELVCKFNEAEDAIALDTQAYEAWIMGLESVLAPSK